MLSSSLAKVEHYYSLFTFYQSLLTEKQREYFTQYFFNNLSLQEIADIYQISRNAIHDSLDKTMKVLDDYEAKLQLWTKYQARKKIFEANQNYDFINDLIAIDEN